MIATSPVSAASFAFGMIKGMQSLVRQRRLPAPYQGSFAALRVVQQRRSIRQNMSRTSARAVLYSMLEVRDSP